MIPPTGGYGRDQLRQTYADAWRKRRTRAPLSVLETTIADLIEVHPEYQALLEDSQAAVGFAAADDGSRENPFLHLGLHLAVREQVAIDRPPGVRELHRLLQARRGDWHAGEHELMQALAETLWEAQRAGRAPDEQHYLALGRRVLDQR
jgi:hypothetical protein